ncbi:MAG: glycoside hydrolase family 130 protein [Acidobacteriaceae bacterium]
MLGPFRRPPGSAPIITPQPQAVFDDPIRKAPVHWEALHTFNPAAVVRNGKVEVLYRAEDDSGTMQIGMHTSRLGLAESTDGIHFTQGPAPIFYPAEDGQKEREWPGGVEDPRVVESEDGAYVLTYTQWNRKTYTVGIATSRDLHTWTKYGPAFGSEPGGKYTHLQYKSAGIVTRLDGSRLIAARLQGKYWMYWGEGEVRLATSTDLIHWTPIEGKDGKPVVLLAARPGHFDSGLPEVGPPPLVTKDGILLVYNGKNGKIGNGKNGNGKNGNGKNGNGKSANGKNAAVNGAPGLPAGTYAVGQALFAADQPARLLHRTAKPFFQPEMPFERSGQYAAGTTFAEGLVFFEGRWYLYYGCADSLVGVAVYDPEKKEPEKK